MACPLPSSPCSKGSARGHTPTSHPCLIAPPPLPHLPRIPPGQGTGEDKAQVWQNLLNARPYLRSPQHPHRVNTMAPTGQVDTLEGLTQGSRASAPPLPSGPPVVPSPWCAMDKRQQVAPTYVCSCVPPRCRPAPPDSGTLHVGPECRRHCSLLPPGAPSPQLSQQVVLVRPADRTLSLHWAQLRLPDPPSCSPSSVRRGAFFPLQVRKLRHSKVKELAPGHMDGKALSSHLSNWSPLPPYQPPPGGSRVLPPARAPTHSGAQSSAPAPRRRLPVAAGIEAAGVVPTPPSGSG